MVSLRLQLADRWGWFLRRMDFYRRAIFFCRAVTSVRSNQSSFKEAYNEDPKATWNYIPNNYKLTFTANRRSFHSKGCSKATLHTQLTIPQPTFLKQIICKLSSVICPQIIQMSTLYSKHSEPSAILNFFLFQKKKLFIFPNSTSIFPRAIIFLGHRSHTARPPQ